MQPSKRIGRRHRVTIAAELRKNWKKARTKTTQLKKTLTKTNRCN